MGARLTCACDDHSREKTVRFLSVSRRREGPIGAKGECENSPILLVQIGRSCRSSQPGSVLKTTVAERLPGVRIPLPPTFARWIATSFGRQPTTFAGRSPVCTPWVRSG